MDLRLTHKRGLKALGLILGIVVIVTTSGRPNTPDAIQHVVDTNGDGRSDPVVVRNTGGGQGGQITWYTLENSHTGSPTARGFAWGAATDFFVPEDFDGDGKTDIAVWRPGNPGTFYVARSLDSTVEVINFGQTGDDPTVVGDYDGDGKADMAIYRSGATKGAASFWWFRRSMVGGAGCTSANCSTVQWGLNGDFPAPGDYDGDGRNDFSIQRGVGGQGRFYTQLSSGPVSIQTFGLSTDQIAPGDYDGDGKTDIAVVRSAGGTLVWWWRPSGGTSDSTVTFGASATDFVTQGDYDGDGKTDAAVWRGGTQGRLWYQGSASGVQTVPWGQTGDYPVANYNVH